MLGHEFWLWHHTAKSAFKQNSDLCRHTTITNQEGKRELKDISWQDEIQMNLRSSCSMCQSMSDHRAKNSAFKRGLCCCFKPISVENKRSYCQLFDCGILNAVWECALLKMLIHFQICNYWKCMKTVLCKYSLSCYVPSPSPSLCLLPKLMTEHCNFMLNLRGTNRTEHPQKFSSIPFCLWFDLFSFCSLFPHT